jgi:hypothetical protein
MGVWVERRLPGRPQGEFAPQKRCNLFGHGSVFIIGRIVVCSVRSGEAAETQQTIAKPQRDHSEHLANNTVLSSCCYRSIRLTGGWQCRGCRAPKASLFGWGAVGKRKQPPSSRPGSSIGPSTALQAQNSRLNPKPCPRCSQPHSPHVPAPDSEPRSLGFRL